MEQKNFEVISQNLREIISDFLKESYSIFIDKDLSNSKKIIQIINLTHQLSIDYIRIVD